MAKLTIALSAALAASASAFAPSSVSRSATALNAEKIWDPLSLYNLEDVNDTFPNMFPKPAFLDEAEIKHGRMAMLAWTGVWATHVGGLGLGMHFPGAPVEPDWTKALGVWMTEDPVGFGIILALIMIAEGEGVSHSGDNFRGMGKKVPGDMGFDWMGMTKKLSPERVARYKDTELKNGRAAMIAMASLFAMESIPGSVPIMDIIS